MDDSTKEALAYGAKALENVTDILNKLAGPLAEEVGLTLGDRAREYRIKNAVKIFARVKKMLAQAGIQPTSIPPRLFLPAIDAATVEAEETLQERWAALLANASDPERRNTVLPSYVEVLKQLTPEESLVLDRVHDQVTVNGSHQPTITERGILIGTSETLFQWALPSYSGWEFEEAWKAFVLLIDDLIRLGIISRADNQDDDPFSAYKYSGNVVKLGPPSVTIEYVITPFGHAFLSACHKPIRRE
jgi:hypothetical protein